ncbi:MAG: hypothetical protein IJH09_13690 [Clostridia bacterium]|nr:hypothetical protein [Clostridia bacterium]
MKRKIAVVIAFCLCLSVLAAGLAEGSHADDFLGGLSKAWDGLLGMASDAGKAVSDWANETGVTEWAENAAQDVTNWANESGVTEWAENAARDVTNWANESGVTEWAEGAADDIQTFARDNGPAIGAWFSQAGENIGKALDSLVNPNGNQAKEAPEAAKAAETAVVPETPETSEAAVVPVVPEATEVPEAAEAHEEAGAAPFAYEHDPRLNPKAMKDIVENPDAVYGFSPSPDSTRLGEFADAIDWTDPEQVAEARATRQAYHDSLSGLYRMIEAMLTEAKPVEEIARAVSQRRNELRIEAAQDDPEKLEILKKSNLETYGNENGPTVEWLYEKYGSWQTVMEKALGTNVGMDVCLGFYDELYELYDIG